jgi:hypothetical protein
LTLDRPQILSGEDCVPKGAFYILQMEYNCIKPVCGLTGVYAQGIADLVEIRPGYLGRLVDMAVQGQTRLF